MQNAFKLFGAKDTESFDLYFKQSRIVLTSAYVLIVAMILLFSGSITRFVFSQRINTRYAQFQEESFQHPERRSHAPNAADVREDLVATVFTVNLILLLITGLLSYGFAGATLRPVRNAYHKQRRFLSDASHELRTPLAILQTNLENDRDAAKSPEARELILSHLEEVTRMNNLVKDLLTISQLHRDSLPAKEHWQQINVNEILLHTVNRLSVLAQKAKITLTAHDDSTSPIFIQAPNQEILSHALTNVIQNAITYNNEHGQVTVSLSAHDSTAQIKVTDTGIGIPKDDIRHVFKRFYRSEKSRSRQLGGSGLGLSIVQTAIESLGGTVAIQSEPEKGTIVTISLPIHRAS